MKTQPLISVKKFGGTSVGSVQRIEAVAERILEGQKQGRADVLVVSAMAGETNRLVALAKDIDPHYYGPAYDMLLASGEQVSVSLLTMALGKRGLKAKPYLAHQLGIHTDSTSSKARIRDIETKKIMNDIQNNIIPVVAGFQGMDENNNITTLGRGGSDTSAVALAAALNADVCEIYTDVSGVYSADPRLVPKAHKIDTISFEEMIEMASLGSKVLHIRCVEIAAKYKLKLHVRSSFDYLEGTMIVGDEDMKIESPVVTAITHEASTAVIRLNPIPGGTETLSKLFMELAEKQIIVDVISQSDHDQGQRLAFSVPVDEIKTCKQVAKNFFPDIEPAVMENVSKVSIVGVGMRSHPGVAARFFNALAKSNVPIHLVTTSEIKVSAIIDHENLEKAANVLHDTFEVKK